MKIQTAPVHSLNTPNSTDRAHYYDLIAQLDFACESLEYYCEMFHRTDDNEFYSLSIDLWRIERDAILDRLDLLRYS